MCNPLYVHISFSATNNFITNFQYKLTAKLYFLDLVLNNSKKKENHTPRSSTGSVLTFTNPNYNLPDDGSASEPKVKIWKRLKYDKAQVNQSLIIKCSQYDETALSVRLIFIYRTVFTKSDALSKIRLQRL